MTLPIIKTPAQPKTRVESVSAYLNQLKEWQKGCRVGKKDVNDGFLGQLWYRGVNRHFDEQVPGVYRPGFTRRSKQSYGEGLEAKRLNLERDMISQFRTASAAFIKSASMIEIYFVAQHFGMPTRLLDWSTNPLAALFFACDGEPLQDGYVYAMDAREVIPENAFKNEAARAKGDKKGRLARSVMTMRHEYVIAAVGLSFWKIPEPPLSSYVLPVRPDHVPGRIGQQSSCFTFHMNNASEMNNRTLASIRIANDEKESILGELRQLNINQFTTYYDLDRLSREVKYGWDVDRPKPYLWSIVGSLIERETSCADALKTLQSLFGPNLEAELQKASSWFQSLQNMLPPK
jgi:hypothetical protein